MYGSIGKLGITGIECCTNQAIAFAKELRGVSTKYMFYYMAMMKSKLISMGKGGTQNNISQTILKSLNVIVPPPEVQDNLVFRIEELFSELDKAVETLQTTKQQLAVYRQAVLKRHLRHSNEKVYQKGILLIYVIILWIVRIQRQNGWKKVNCVCEQRISVRDF